MAVADEAEWAAIPDRLAFVSPSAQAKECHSTSTLCQIGLGLVEEISTLLDMADNGVPPSQACCPLSYCC